MCLCALTDNRAPKKVYQKKVIIITSGYKKRVPHNPTFRKLNSAKLGIAISEGVSCILLI